MPISPSFEQLTSWDNLHQAFIAASKGKRSRWDVASFEIHLEDNLYNLQDTLQHYAWIPSAYQHFYIHEPKRRLISAAPFKDRIVHHALCQVIEPSFENSFIKDSYANRIGKGNHRALNQAQIYARQFPYVLQLDIQKFFPNISHSILQLQLAKKIQDRGVLWLIDQILESGCEQKGQNSKGLPIGNLTSQFWANVFMNPIDHFIKRELRCKGYVRYVDDLLLFAQSKDQLWDYKQRLEYRLKQHALKVHLGTHPKPTTEGISFLGFMVFTEHRNIKRRKALQYHRKLKQLIKAYEGGLLEKDKVVESAVAWSNHAGYGNTVGLRKKLLSELQNDFDLFAKLTLTG